MNDNLIIIGINAPRRHQAIITQLIYGLTGLYKNGPTGLFPYPETMIDEGQTSPVPDVMLVDLASDLTKVSSKSHIHKALRRILRNSGSLCSYTMYPKVSFMTTAKIFGTDSIFLCRKAKWAIPIVVP